MSKQTNKTIGTLGELIAERHLIKEGYKIIAKNVREKWGEIDLIADNKKEIVFIEVKTLIQKSPSLSNLKPEDQMTNHKIQHLQKSILHYLNKNKINGDYRVDLISVELYPQSKKYHLRHYKNIL
ncbi:MAG: YraN family protein [Patescibacteria group bacterium]|jgi:putative endonuclease|nr:YraN family protein [Patescibacteria group bacterium]